MTSASGSKNRQRLSAFDHDPRPAEGEADVHQALHRLPPFQHGVVHVVIERAAIGIGHETRELRIAETAARISPKSKPDGRTMTEIQQKTQHITVTTL